MMSLVVTDFVLSFLTGCLGWDLGLCHFLKIFLLNFDMCVCAIFIFLTDILDTKQR